MTTARPAELVLGRTDDGRTTLGVGDTTYVTMSTDRAVALAHRILEMVVEASVSGHPDIILTIGGRPVIVTTAFAITFAEQLLAQVGHA